MQNQAERSCKILIGSYPYRSTFNIPRLLCQYIGVQYENIFFNPCSWKAYKQNHCDHWILQQLPFLIDGNVVVTQTFPMCEYIAKKWGRTQLLGESLEDRYMVDSILWGRDLIQSLLSLVVENKNNPKKLMEEIHSTWTKTIKQHLLQYEKNASYKGFYLGYLTVVDFLLYEMFEYFKTIFRKDIALFPRLVAIREKVAALDVVKQFQKSDRFVKQMCPLEFYKKWKMESLKNSGVQFDPKQKQLHL